MPYLWPRMKFLLFILLSALCWHNLMAQDCFSISGRGSSMTPWTDIRQVNLQEGSSVVLYAEQTKEYELQSLDRNLGDAILDQLTPMGQGVASCAYDVNRKRLFYSTMDYADLRYFNLDSANPMFTIVQIGLIPDAAFNNAPTQFSRMTIAADGLGYMLNNDARKFFRFTTDKKPKIESLGSLSNAVENNDSSKNIFLNLGGDMIADASGNLILFTAKQTVFRIDVKTLEAHYVGKVSGLPNNFTMNGAAVKNNHEVVVGSALSLSGLYVVSLYDLTAKPLDTHAEVFTCSDLDNGMLLPIEGVEALAKRAAELAKPPVITPQDEESVEEENALGFYFQQTNKSQIQLVFSKDETGEFLITLSDGKGKIMLEQKALVSESNDQVSLRLPQALSKGIYFIKAIHQKSGHTYLRKLEVNG